MTARTYSLATPATATVRAAGALDQRQIKLTADRIGTVVLPWWPDEIAWSGMAATYEEQARPGRLPLLLRSGAGLQELRIGTVVRPRDLGGERAVSSDGAASARSGESLSPAISSILDTLRLMSRAVKPVTVSIAGRSGSYRITDLGITELEWSTEGSPLVAEISLTLLQASEAAVPVGPIRGKGGR